VNPFRPLRRFLRHFHDQEAAEGAADQGTQDIEYDDRQSLLPFINEEQDLERSSHQRKPEKHQDNAGHQHNLVKWTRRLAYTTGALAFATFGVALFAGWQAWEMRQGSIDTGRLATAAQQQADTAATALEGLERPFVIVDIPHHDPLWSWINGLTPMIELDYTLTNYGRVPAVLLETWCEGIVTDGPPDGKTFDENRLVKTNQINRTTVVSQGSTERFKCSELVRAIGATLLKYSGDQRALHDERVKIGFENKFWVVAFAAYRDIFGKVREIKECMRVGPTRLIRDGDEGCNAERQIDTRAHGASLPTRPPP
jgi:hypothetical protein